jgi:hypothetical protein
VTLPGVEAALVDAAKTRDDLLSVAHPVGRFKSAFFVALGYPAADWEILAADLRRHAMDNKAVATEKTEYGQKYEVRGRIQGPAGKAAALAAVWIVLRSEDFPRFVTAFPGARS